VRLQASRKGVKRFVEAGFGMSVHWGLYALIGHGEWVYFQEGIPFEKYRALMTKFNPVRFDANEWADLMVEAGQKSLAITSKHHDGFCMWDTALTDFKVTRTPFGRDVLAELAVALRERGIALHFYYSLVDWTHPAYRTDWPRYVEYYHGQLRELCTNYGPIGGFLFDGYWPNWDMDKKTAKYCAPRGAWDFTGAYDLIHKLQPDAVITNNSHRLPLKGEDYQVWEQDLPGENRFFRSNCTQVGTKPTAAWWTVQPGWSYTPRDHNPKRADDLIEFYRRAKAKKAVFMLNVGPRPWGDIHPDEQRVLRKMGAKLRTLGL